jgi:hypothetical protein
MDGSFVGSGHEVDVSSIGTEENQYVAGSTDSDI